MAPKPSIQLFIAASVTFILIYKFLGGKESPETSPKKPGTGYSDHKLTVVAVGDLHGDFGNMIKVLKMAHVVSSNGSWTGDVDYLVQTGDIVDRGDDTIKMYKYLENLRAQARAVGGNVVSHLGNHEVMNLLGDWRYVPQSEIKTFGSPTDRQKMITTGWIGQAWRANYSITTRLPLHPRVGEINTDFDASDHHELSHAALSFLHGGLSPSFHNLTPYPSAINEIGARLVRRLQDRKHQPKPHPPYPYEGIPSDATPEEHELYGADGPLWYRGWAMDRESDVCAAVDDMLQRTGVRRLVMGHTPNFNAMVSRCKGKIILIDTGISHAYGGVLSAARFTYSISPSSTDDKWIENDVVHAIYQDREELLAADKRILSHYKP
ncbi:hypothetical protein FRC02_003305 [Tulasnella sp. 418]|nr:hypothetical protein FRC02_003305 [Tulasnella sp. 418]